MPVRLYVPERITATNASAFCLRLAETALAPRLLIDFQQIKFVVPQGTMCLFVGIKRVLEQRVSLSLPNLEIINSTNPSDAFRYLVYMGFFKRLANVDIDNEEPQLSTDRTYIRLSPIVIDRSGANFKFQARLDEATSAQATFLLKDKAPEHPAVMAVGWCLREAIRNVFEHAGTDTAYVTGQSWKSGRVELAIGDAGMGIPVALAPVHNPRDASHALSLAVQPGITDYTGPDTDDKWQNSGFGLYMLRRIAQDYGSLTVVSGGAFLKTATGDAAPLVKGSGSPLGTTIALSLEIPDDIYFANVLDQYATAGEQETLGIVGARRRASAGSRSMWS